MIIKFKKVGENGLVSELMEEIEVVGFKEKFIEVREIINNLGGGGDCIVNILKIDLINK